MQDVARVVFDVSARVPFEVFTLENPHRIVVDLDSARPRAGCQHRATRRWPER